MYTEHTASTGVEGKRSVIGTVTESGRSSITVVVGTSKQVGGNGVTNSPAVELGQYLLVEAGAHMIFGQLSDLKLGHAGHDGDVSHPIGQIELLASIESATGSIVSGVASRPSVGGAVFYAPPKLVQQIVEGKRRISDREDIVRLDFARLRDVAGLAVTFTPEKLFSRHCAILGATGGGKSWTLARVMEECSRYNSKVILFDATGEYHRLTHGVRHVYLGADSEPLPGSIEVTLPYYQLTEGDLFAIFKPRGQSQAPKLRAAMKSLKLARLVPPLAPDGTIIKAHKSKQQYEEAYRRYVSYVESSSADFDIWKLSRQVQNECVTPDRSPLEPNFWGGPSGEDQSSCVALVNRINDIIQSEDLAPIFNPGDKASLLEEIESFVDDPADRILRISLKHLSFAHNAREIIANAAGRHLLRMARASRFRASPLIVVVDEAHQFLDKSLAEESSEFPLDSFGLIAKEGRKYWLNICIATQRPRDIPESVLSQMGTLIVHRLINDRDRSVIERACGELDKTAASALPSLAPGEAMIVGVDFPIPLCIKVEPPGAKPDSDSPNYQGTWL